MSDAMLAALVGGFSGGLLGAIITIIGWYITAGQSRRQAEESRRQVAALQHLQNQIEELYGPLNGLIQQYQIGFSLAKKHLPVGQDGLLDLSRDSTSYIEVWDYFTKNFFFPLSKQMRRLISTKLHLIENGTLPQSFLDFLNFEMDYESQNDLFKEYNIETSLHMTEWPVDFARDTQLSLERLRKKYQDYLKRIAGL